MKERGYGNMDNRNIISGVCDAVVEMCEPLKVVLISKKMNPAQQITGFKLCVVLPDSTGSVSEVEARLYMQIESDAPFDLILYKESEWNDLKDDAGTFAWKIADTGTVLYERE